jgi:gliding motility-associated-like protein
MKTGNSNLYNGMVQGLSDGLNLLEWRISNGDVCLDSFDEVELTVPEVKLITGFSPNSDGVNDFFVINGLVEWDGGVVPNELVITDMAGVILYQEKDYGNDWDGRDMRGKPLPSGTYYYFINVFYSTKVQLKGFVIIKRD